MLFAGSWDLSPPFFLRTASAVAINTHSSCHEHLIWNPNFTITGATCSYLIPKFIPGSSTCAGQQPKSRDTSFVVSFDGELGRGRNYNRNHPIEQSTPARSRCQQSVKKSPFRPHSTLSVPCIPRHSSTLRTNLRSLRWRHHRLRSPFPSVIDGGIDSFISRGSTAITWNASSHAESLPSRVRRSLWKNNVR